MGSMGFWQRLLRPRSAADARVLGAGRRRMRSGRGSAYMEFALLAPVLLMVCSLLVELATFWDASVMANHAAWTVGRIVKVKASAKDAQIFQVGKVAAEDGSLKKTAVDGLNKAVGALNTFGDQRSLATAMLMSTCSMGYVGTPGDELKDLFHAIVTEPLDAVAKEIPGMLKTELTKPTAKLPVGGGLASALLGALADKLTQAIVDPIINAVTEKLLSPVTGWVEKQLSAVGGKISGLLDQKEGGFSRAKHYARNFQKVYQRVKVMTMDKKGTLVSVQTDASGGMGFLAPTGTLRHPRLPAGDSGLQGQVAYVRVQWPMASDWLFPLFWGGDRGGKGVWATGHSLTLLEPSLKNAHLSSTDPAPYDPPKANVGAFGNLSEDIRRDLRIELFLMRYRNTRETVEMKGAAGKTVHIQPWKDIAYPKKENAAYRESWRAALNGVLWTSRYLLAATLDGYLRRGGGYHRREWLRYEGERDKRYRYTGTVGESGPAVLTPSYAASLGEAIGLANRFGHGSGVPDALPADLAKAQSAAETQRIHLAKLRGHVDEAIKELERRCGDASGGAIEFSADEMASLSGADLAGGDAELSEAKLRARWKKALGDIKAARNRINGLARTIGGACETLAAAEAALAGRKKDFEAHLKDARKTAKAKKPKADKVKPLGDDLRAVAAATRRIASAADTLDKALEAAWREENALGKLLGLKVAKTVGPEGFDWDKLTGEVAPDDGVGPEEKAAEEAGVYGDKDGFGEGPWKR